MKKGRAVFLFVIGLFFASQVLAAETDYKAAETDNRAAETDNRAAETEYRVGEGDVLNVTVYDHPDLTTILRVSSGGSILFPLVGQLHIDGLTVDQVAEKITDELSNGYIVNTQVSVFIKEFRSKKVTIIGEVQNPGLYELRGVTSLLELISKAGGPTKNYGDSVTIHRKSGDEKSGEHIYTIDLKRILENGAADLDVPIMDGDSLVVAKAKLFYVTGEVERPDAYKYEEGATVIKAITMAGGFTNVAAKGKVKIYRKINGEENVAKNVAMDVPIQPEDVIVIPESFF